MRRRALGRALVLALLIAVCLPAPKGHSAWVARITYYTFGGVTASGEWTHDGGAACSYDLPLGTTVHFVGTNMTVVCNDRGLLSSTWIDVWAPSGWPAAVLGDYAEIEVW